MITVDDDQTNNMEEPHDNTTSSAKQCYNGEEMLIDANIATINKKDTSDDDACYGHNDLSDQDDKNDQADD